MVYTVSSTTTTLKAITMLTSSQGSLRELASIIIGTTKSIDDDVISTTPLITVASLISNTDIPLPTMIKIIENSQLASLRSVDHTDSQQATNSQLFSTQNNIIGST